MSLEIMEKPTMTHQYASASTPFKAAYVGEETQGHFAGVMDLANVMWSAIMVVPIRSQLPIATGASPNLLVMSVMVMCSLQKPVVSQLWIEMWLNGLFQFNNSIKM